MEASLGCIRLAHSVTLGFLSRGLGLTSAEEGASGHWKGDPATRGAAPSVQGNGR